MAGLEDPEASPGLFDSESEFEGLGSLQPSPTDIKQKPPHAPITSNDIGAVDTETTAGELLQALQADVVMEDAPLPSDQPNSGGLMQENVDQAQKGHDEDDDGDEDGDDYIHEQSGSENQSEVGRRIGENSSRSSSSIVGKANSSGYSDSRGTSTSGNHERLQILIPSFTGFKDGEYHVAPPSHLENGRVALNRFRDPDNMDETYPHRSSKRRKVRHDSDYDSATYQINEPADDDDLDIGYHDDEDEDEDEDNDDDDDDDDVVFKRHPSQKRRSSNRISSRISTRNTTRRTKVTVRSSASVAPSGSKRSLRTKTQEATRRSQAQDDQDSEADELAKSDSDYPIIVSDVLPVKPKKQRGRPSRHSFREASIEFETRRSGRTNKTTKSMDVRGLGDDDDESFYVEDKHAGAPKVISIKEVFKPVQDEKFNAVHSTMCDTCGQVGHNAQKGILIPCQGCSFAYHKTCIGYRAGREHRATKIGPGDFVLQCRFCIGFYRKRDGAPRHDKCQGCNEEGKACKEFSPKLTGRAEEKIRIANNGEDPVTPVPANLINNAEVVLFRCAKCKRAYHYEHLPRVDKREDPDDTEAIRANRLAEYTIDHKCRDCLDITDKIEALVAWRPADMERHKDQPFSALSDDVKEYLVKWATKSHAHCTWLPGAWVYGVVNGTMRASFAKRNDGDAPPPAADTDAAIPEEWLMPDIILAVRYQNGSDSTYSKQDALAKISKVKQVRVKFQGLPYSDTVWDAPPSKDKPRLWNAFKEAYCEWVAGKYFEDVGNSTMLARMKQWRALDPYPSIQKQPEGLASGCKLMGYQVEGVDWLVWNYYKLRSCVLADEMGLGKTIQICAFMAALALNEPKCWPFLVVVPNSTCPNWRREIKQWVPDLRVVCYHGGKVPQDLALRNELFPDGRDNMKAHVVVMSYDSASDMSTRTYFKNVHWKALVVDEGQRLKNDQNILYVALRAMKIPFRILLTGTPLQNNKRELFNLVQFIDSSKNAAKLDERFAELTKENIPQLHDEIKPYFLRRTKAEVLKFLPPMGQVIVPVTMSFVQEKLCKSIMTKSPQLIQAIFAKNKMGVKERGSLNNILMQLRKCLCHPFVYSRDVEDTTLDPETMQRNLIEASPKLVLLSRMLPKLKEKGHRVLIFSQFLDQLDIIEDFLAGLGFLYQRLDGTMSSLEKQKRIDEFNAPSSELFAFLLSTRAGGVGINLATADTVIIMDPDFNPHQDLQALSRAHRIGQMNKVLCFQLMTKGSVEEKIMQIGRKKMALDHVLIETMDDEEAAPDDLESILKHGAEQLFNDDNEKEVIKYDDTSIEKLLDRSHLVNPELNDSEKRDREFTLARVWRNDKGTLADDLEVAETGTDVMDSTAWHEIIRERELLAQREAEKNAQVYGRGGRRRQNVTYAANENEGQKSESEKDEDFVANEEESAADSDESSDEELDRNGNPVLKEISNPAVQQLPPNPGRISTTAVPIPDYISGNYSRALQPQGRAGTPGIQIKLSNRPVQQPLPSLRQPPIYPQPPGGLNGTAGPTAVRQQPAVESGLRRFCDNCCLPHPPQARCPIDTTSELSLRLTIDALRTATNDDRVHIRNALQEKLRHLRAVQAAKAAQAANNLGGRKA
ncbi:hypothetical protein MCOR21_009810 [Pyricularia oryzae]|nr:hypothetical protein MCOR21_009810 [Pyricularia oryzae]KAI6450241.1 hypothetical protein MCOR15_009481 [Pyricularia oryzae]KAI6469283.1 hypothetical protein MCOR18_009267 [Pyricularia oryzae]KAI6505993.1 hypothetical protein MCOR10_011533 [Pyricularia oryzae]KAI6514598.1 hypothetical protein MCOR16_010497 [Pyricularia oryzae]